MDTDVHRPDEKRYPRPSVSIRGPNEFSGILPAIDVTELKGSFTGDLPGMRDEDWRILGSSEGLRNRWLPVSANLVS
jgi:hypothetical protein